MLKPLPVVRVADQLLIVPPKPEVWRCHYENCGFAVVVHRRTVTPQAVADHILYVHYMGEDPRR